MADLKIFEREHEGTGRHQRGPVLSRVMVLLAAAGLWLAAVPALAQASGTAVSAQLARDLAKVSERDRDLQKFYQARDFRPLWIDNGRVSPAATTLVAMLERADVDGLSVRALRPDKLAEIVRAASDGSAMRLAYADIALSRALAAYVQGTRIARETSGMQYQSSLLEPAVPSPGSALSAAAAAPSLDAYIARQQWMHPWYVGLRDALATQPMAPYAEGLVRVNIERARAIPVNPAARYVLIDAAAARLWMYEGGKPVDSMKVVVGKAEEPTPMIAGLITNALLNPYWNVPPDLVRKNIATNVLDRGLGYLKSSRYEVLDGWTDEARVIDPATVDWQAVAAGTREARVRQLPGGGNFMGQVKFEFPNALGIYLHDTPAKQLMGEDARQLSSGCIRLEDAPRLARWLFGKVLKTPKGAVELPVLLDQPVPVYVTYLTAAPVDGRVVFRQDVYDRDKPQIAAR